MGKVIFKFEVDCRGRLDEFLRQSLPVKIKSLGGEYEKAVCSNSKIRRLILASCVFVNGRAVTRPAFELRGKSLVRVEFEPEKFFFEKQPEDIKFILTDKDVLFENEELIFVNKPPFFPVEQTITGNRANLHDAVVDYLWAKNPSLRNPPYVGIMHRLDRETSGVILFTKTRDANKKIHEMFENHDFTKKYYAVVENPAEKNAHSHIKKSFSGGGAVGKITQNLAVGSTFTVENFLGRISGKSQKGKWGSVKEKDGLYAKTDFTIVKECTLEGRKCLLIECNLYTGRTHQIRVHLSESGLPILGDELYGGAPAKRLYLHAAELTANDGSFSVKSEEKFWD
ncbi:MAG: RluA family pseudouridine synthase [Treponema sp.]|nr:RluA family pseudouridine synthase [Treponema sp.]